MRTALLVSAGSILLVLLITWVTWNYVLSPVNRVFISMLFGVGGVSGQ